MSNTNLELLPLLDSISGEFALAAQDKQEASMIAWGVRTHGIKEEFRSTYIDLGLEGCRIVSVKEDSCPSDPHILFVACREDTDQRKLAEELRALLAAMKATKQRSTEQLMQTDYRRARGELL